MAEGELMDFDVAETTTATISHPGKEKALSNVLGVSTDAFSCVAAGAQLVFLDGSCHEHYVTQEFEAEIDAVTMTEDGRFLVAGDASGFIHLFDCSTQTRILSKMLVDLGDTSEGKVFQNLCFSSVDEQGSCDLLVMVGSEVHVIENLQVTALQEALDSSNMQKAAGIQAGMNHVVLKTDERNKHEALYVVPGSDRGHIITVGTSICIWRKTKKEYVPADAVSTSVFGGSAIVKCVPAQNHKLLFILDNEGLLSLINLEQSILVSQWRDLVVKDFTLMDRESREKCDARLAILVDCSEDSPEDVPKRATRMDICRLPSLESIYSLKLLGSVFLTLSLGAQEAVFLVEDVPAETGKSKQVSTLRVRSVTEAAAEERLFQLLHKHKFDEAEKFAKQFNQDVQIVHKAQTSHLFNLLRDGSERQKEETEKLIQDLVASLSLIKDDVYVAENCINAELPTFKATHEILKLIKSRLSHRLSNDPGTDQNTMIKLLDDTLASLHRLETYQVTFGIDSFSSELWNTFLKANMLEEVLLQLKEGNLDIVVMLWNRHQGEFSESFSQSDLQNLLRFIPERAASTKLKAWLTNDVIPCIIRNCPEGLPLVANWVEQRSRNMELFEKDGWPSNALDFCKLLQNTCISVSRFNGLSGLASPHEMSTQISNMPVDCYQTRRKKSDVGADSGLFEAFDSLSVLTTQLQNLIKYHTVYNCRLTLAEYVRENCETRAYRMLDRVSAIELVPAAIEKFVRPYTKEYALNEDKILTQYITDLARRSGSSESARTGQLQWELRAIAVIGCINDTELKIQGVIDALRSAHVPWSADMEELAQNTMSLDHPRSSEIQELRTVMELRSVLIRYGLRDYTLRDDVQSLHTLVKFILQKDRPTALKDALQVVESNDKLTRNDVIFTHIIFLIEGKRLPDALVQLKSLASEDVVLLAKHLVTLTKVWLDCTLQHDPETKKDPETQEDETTEDENQFGQFFKSEKTLLTAAALEFIQVALDNDPEEMERQEFQKDYNNLRTISTLQREFGEFVTHRDLLDNDYQNKLLDKYMAKYFEGLNDSEETEDSIKYPELCRFGEALGHSGQKIKAQIALSATTKGLIKIAVDTAKELYVDLPSPDVARSLYEIAHALCDYLSSPTASKIDGIAAIHQDVRDMAQKAVCYCPADLICDCLALSETLSLSHDVWRKCETGDYASGIQRKPADPVLAKKLFGDLYEDEGLVMDSKEVTPMLYKYSMARIPSKESSKAPYKQNRVEGMTRTEDSPVREENPPPNPLQSLRTATQDLVLYLSQHGHLELALRYSHQALSVAVQHTNIQFFGGLGKNSESGADTMARNITDEIELCLDDLKDKTKTLLQRIINKGRIDHCLALGYLCDLSKEKAFEFLQAEAKKAGTQYKKKLVISQLGMDLSTMTRDAKLKDLWENYAVNYKWGLKLTKLKVPFDDFFKLRKSEKMSIVPALVSSKNVTIRVIKDFCSSYNLDAKHASLLYLKELLLPTKYDKQGALQVTQDVNTSLGKARDAVREIDNPELVTKTLKDIFDKIDVYDYERLNFVLEILAENCPSPYYETSLKLLQMLKLYTRVSPPGDYELKYRPLTEEQEQMYGTPKLPEQSTKRLPFQPLLSKAKWQIISPELNESTVETLLPIATLLKLETDMVYLTTIRNVLRTHNNERKKKDPSLSDDPAKIPTAIDKSKCSWTLDREAEEHFFPTIKKLLLKLDQCSNMATCMNYVMKELPLGAEKIKALEACVEMAKTWAEVCTKEQADDKMTAIRMYEKYSSWYKRISIEQALFQHNCGTPELLALSNNPAKLILTLYEDKSILKRAQPDVVLDSLPDIHKLTTVIAQIASLDIQKIRLSLIEQWLPSTRQDDADMTFDLTGMDLDVTDVSEDDQTNQDEINLQRVIYLLQNDSTSPLFLLNYVHKKDNPSITNLCRVRALRCLFSIMDIKSVNSILNQPFPENNTKLDVLLTNLLYMVKLDRLHLPQSMNMDWFINCNKEGLVRSIWLKHSHDQEAVRLVSDLCLDYKIRDVQLWNSLLQQLMTFQMLDYLRHILVTRLSCSPELWKVPTYLKAWSCVILRPLNTARPPLNEEHLADCLDSYELIHRCPQMYSLDLVSLSQHFVRLGLPTCGLGCVLLIVDTEERTGHVTELLADKGQVEVIHKQLCDWSTAGRNIPMMQKINNACGADSLS